MHVTRWEVLREAQIPTIVLSLASLTWEKVTFVQHLRRFLPQIGAHFGDDGQGLEKTSTIGKTKDEQNFGANHPPQSCGFDMRYHECRFEEPEYSTLSATELETLQELSRYLLNITQWG
jgi:hypothetical protein